MKKFWCIKISAILITLLSGFIVISWGQEPEFPTRAITVYVGFPPGGTAAISGQVIAEMLKENLGQPVIINYKPGAQQAVAGAFVAKAKPDGYTLLWVAELDFNNKLIIEAKSLTFRREDFVPIMGTAINPYVLVVKSDAPWKNLDELIVYGRTHPGELSYGSSGVGAFTHLGVELFAHKTGIKVNHIPFQGGGPALTALLGGHVKLGLGGAGRFLPHLKSGSLRSLAVFFEKRIDDFPSVPTAKEQGYDIEMELFHALLAPKGLPINVKNKLIQSSQKGLDSPKYKEMMTKAGFDPTYLNPMEVNKKIAKEEKRILIILTEIGLLEK